MSGLRIVFTAFDSVELAAQRCDQMFQLDGQFVGPTEHQGESSEAAGEAGAEDEDDSLLEPTELEEVVPVTAESA